MSISEMRLAEIFWTILCHSLWLLPMIGLAIAPRFHSVDPDRADRRMRFAIAACMILPPVVAGFHFAMRDMLTRTPLERTPPVALRQSKVIARPDIASPLRESIADRPNHPTPEILSWRTIVRSSAPWLVFAWAVGASLMIVRLVCGSIVLRLMLDSKPASPEIQAEADRLAACMGLKRAPGVFTSCRAAQPMLAGLFRSRIVLPESWLAEAGEDLREAVLAHELAHARRNDLRNLLKERLASAVWFFHPAVHRLRRQAALWRELAADKLAIEATGKPVAFAIALESVAVWANDGRRSSRFGFGGLAFLASRPRGCLLTRIEAIVEKGGSSPMKVNQKAHWTIGSMTVILAGFAVLMVQAKPFVEGSKIRTAIPISGESTVSVGAGNANAGIIVYEVRLVNVDTEFAGKLLRTVVNPPPGHFLPEHLVIGKKLTRALISHPSASSIMFPKVRAAERASVSSRWESPNQVKIAMFERFGRPVPEKIRNEKVWTEFRFLGESSGDGVELQSEITDYNDRLRLSQSPGVVTGPANMKSAPYAISVTEELKLNETTKLKPGESLCVRLGESLEPYRKEPPFLYERVLGEKGARVSQFLRLAIVTARVADEAAE